MIDAIDPSRAPLLLAIEPVAFKLVLFVIFLLIGGFGKILSALEERAKRKRELERFGKRLKTAQQSDSQPSSNTGNRELRSGPMAQTELEERLRKMLGRGVQAPVPNRAGNPIPPPTNHGPFAHAPVATARPKPHPSDKPKKASKTKPRTVPMLETADGARRSREKTEAAKRRGASATDPIPISAATRSARSLLRGGPASLRQAFILSEVLNRKHF